MMSFRVLEEPVRILVVRDGRLSLIKRVKKDTKDRKGSLVIGCVMKSIGRKVFLNSIKV